MLPPPTLHGPRMWLTAGLAALALGGCGLLGDLEDSGGIVDVFTAHHGTPVDDAFPALGEAGMARRFTNDLGWEITLAEAYVTTVGVDLAGCTDGSIRSVDLYWGPSAEDLIGVRDALAKGIGGMRSSANRYCQIRVRYGPYSFAEASSDGAEYPPPGNAGMEGRSVMLRGLASRDGEEVQFDFMSGLELAVIRDISTIDRDRPLTVRDDESFSVKIVLTKTYDRFFDGIDFADFDDAEIEAAVSAALEIDTRALLGTDLRSPR